MKAPLRISKLLHTGLLAVVAMQLASFAFAQEETPTHTEVDPIKLDLGRNGRIETMAMNRGGKLLLGVSIVSPSAKRSPREYANSPLEDRLPREYAVKVVSQQGKVDQTWPMADGLAPKMIHACDDGDIYVSGHGAIGLFDENGKRKKLVEFADMLDGDYKLGHASGVTANDKYFFLAFGDGFSLRATEDIVRLDRDLSNARVIVKKQFGCCAHLDLDCQGDMLLIAENSRHRVNLFSFDGEKIGTWGQRDRRGLEGFAACCNPVNFDFGPEGVLYTAESGIGRVKRYSAEGKLLGVVGYVDTTKFDRGSRLAAQSCYIPIEVSADGKRVFIMDVRTHFIRVLQAKES